MGPIFLFLNKEFEEKEGSERFLSECQIIGRREDTTKNLGLGGFCRVGECDRERNRYFMGEEVVLLTESSWMLRKLPKLRLGEEP